MTSPLQFSLCNCIQLIGVLFLMLTLTCGVDLQEDPTNTNDLTEFDTKVSQNKFDPTLFDILGSDYFDDDDDNIKESNNKSHNAPPAPSEGLPVQPAVEEEIVTTNKPYCVGCPIEVDTEDSKIKEMALFAFNTHLNNFDSLDQAQRIVRVVNAMTQIVAGQKYILDLEVGLTNCTKGEHDANPQNCQLDPTEETFICNFEVVERNWVQEKEVVRSNCNREQRNDNDAPPYEEDVAEEDYKKEEETGLDTNLASNEVEQTTTTHISLKRRKRNVNNLGGQRDAEDSKETLMDLAKFAVEQLDAIDADTDARMVMEVLDSKKQTVSGWLYDLTIRVAHTTCPEGEPVTMEKCKNKIVAPYRICSVKILFQPWQPVQKKVTESQCYPEKYKKGKKLAKQLSLKELNDVGDRKYPILGGYENIDVNTQEINELVNFIIDSIDQQSNALHAQKLVKIVEAQRQIVSGVKTKLVVELGYTGCRKVRALDKSQCQIDNTREHQFCNVTVWEQPWLKSKEITHSKCGAQNLMFKEKRDKRSLSLFSLPGFTDIHEQEFQKFLKHHEKNYETEEEYKYRLGVFKENMKKVKLLQDNEQGTAEYGATIFADLTEEEFSRNYLGLRPDLKQGAHNMKKAKVTYLKSLPNEFDWRNYNAVTPVKNQGMCGSCWAFSVTGNIEGLYAKKHNKLLSFSEQELVDCDTLDEGCNGGLPENAYKILQKLGGLETETAYPYDGHNDKCAFDAEKAKAKVSGFVEIPKNETDMAMWLVKNGPISIGINANAMQFYFGGVSHPWKFLCSKKSLDHGVLIVGYGVHTTSIKHKTMPYWIVKNSWGASWGEKGYYRVYRGENTCGVAEMATSAVVE